jgi:hypothetical protein
MRHKPSGLFVKTSMSEETPPSHNGEPTSPETPVFPPKVSWKEILYGGNNPADHSMNWTFACFGFWAGLVGIMYLFAWMDPPFLQAPWAIWLVLKSFIVFGLAGLGAQIHATVLVYRSRHDMEHSAQRYYAMVLCILGWVINGIISLALLTGGLLGVP